MKCDGQEGGQWDKSGGEILSAFPRRPILSILYYIYYTFPGDLPPMSARSLSPAVPLSQVVQEFHVQLGRGKKKCKKLSYSFSFLLLLLFFFFFGGCGPWGAYLIFVIFLHRRDFLLNLSPHKCVNCDKTYFATKCVNCKKIA